LKSLNQEIKDKKMFKIKGRIKAVNQTVQVSEKFAKREFVVTDESEKYPQDIMLQLTQDKCSLLNAVQVNQEVEVSFNLRGRGWTNPQGEVKYFNTLEAWRIDLIGAAVVNAVQSDDLPF